MGVDTVQRNVTRSSSSLNRCLPKRRHEVGSLLDHHHRHYLATILLSPLPLQLNAIFHGHTSNGAYHSCLNSIFFSSCCSIKAKRLPLHISFEVTVFPSVRFSSRLLVLLLFLMVQHFVKPGHVRLGSIDPNLFDPNGVRFGPEGSSIFHHQKIITPEPRMEIAPQHRPPRTNATECGSIESLNSVGTLSYTHHKKCITDCFFFMDTYRAPKICLFYCR